MAPGSGGCLQDQLDESYGETGGFSGNDIRACGDDWLDQRAESWLSGIVVAVVDPFRGYATGLTDRLETAIVVDHFHAVRLGNQAIDGARRRV